MLSRLDAFAVRLDASVLRDFARHSFVSTFWHAAREPLGRWTGMPWLSRGELGGRTAKCQTGRTWFGNVDRYQRSKLAFVFLPRARFLPLSFSWFNSLCCWTRAKRSSSASVRYDFGDRGFLGSSITPDMDASEMAPDAPGQVIKMEPRNRFEGSLEGVGA